MQVTNTSKTDINGLVFGLLALNSGNYTQDSYWLVQAILTQQNADGSWSANADTKPASDVDMTAMALQALAPYYKDGGNETVNTAVEKALNWLSGKYRSGYDSSESCAQVVIALSALNLDANTDARFTKTVEGKTLSVLGNLLQYRVAENGGFKHQFADKAVNEMATEQALCAMAAYARFTEKANALYDMTDAACAHRFGEWQVTVAATCTKDGVSRRICSICGAVEEKSVPATGHNFGAWTVTKAATCTESGISTRKCSVCGTEETMIVPSLGHSMTATAGKAATCTEAGNSAYWTCSRCHKYFSDAAGKTEIAKDSWVIAAWATMRPPVRRWRPPATPPAMRRIPTASAAALSSQLARPFPPPASTPTSTASAPSAASRTRWPTSKAMTSRWTARTTRSSQAAA